MGKRKSKDAEYIKKKIQKLEDKLKSLSGKEDSGKESTPSRPRSPRPTSPLPIELEDITLGAPTITNNINEDNLTLTEDELPEEFLLALGSEGEEKDEVGEPIRPELTVRWSKIMKDGLGKEAKKNLLEKYPTPSNFPSAIAPLMNPEIEGILSEVSTKRDKRIIHRQNLTGKILNSLGQALTNILKGNINSKLLIEQINDAAKLATEIHHQDSCSRRFFALAGANKMVQDAVKTAKVDKYLFGSDCTDRLKAAQSIQKNTTQLTENTKRIKQQTRKPLNWKGPSRNRQPLQSTHGGPHLQQMSYRRQPPFDRSRQKERRHPPTRPKFSRQRH